jgi:hypothetical protein
MKPSDISYNTKLKNKNQNNFEINEAKKNTGLVIDDWQPQSPYKKHFMYGSIKNLINGNIPSFKTRPIGSTFSLELQSFQNSDFEQMKRGRIISKFFRDFKPRSR